ncbi:MAG: leucine--tRNA ligase [Egibacteraceae bacterium]
MLNNTTTPQGSAPTRGTPPHRYDASLANEIELQWQAQWDAEGTFHTPNPTGGLAEGFERLAGRPKIYVLDMFPYPSGAGLHVGHPLGYIGTDVYARYKRMCGYHVLHPFGYDAFGLPAEQYAVQTGQHPRVTTEANIANMRRQLHRLGLAHDPRRDIATTDVEFYRWTQWIFLQIFHSWFDPQQRRARPISELVAEFETGKRTLTADAKRSGKPWSELPALERRKVVDSYRLAYAAQAPVNWCPGLGTVLANEEVTADGRSEIGNFPVFRRPLKQWMIRITAYAERLIEDLDLLDWPESIKQMQRNWIGRSEGAEIEFPSAKRHDSSITVFTTRPDTLFGATYMVLAPEHPLVDELTPVAWPSETPAPWKGAGLSEAGAPAEGWTSPAEAVAAYRRYASTRSDRERVSDTRTKTGVFTGTYAVNPASGEQLPILIADYVLTDYGTGAIMAVPAHDQRDFEFAQRFGLPIRAVVRPASEWLAEHRVSDATPASEWPEAFEGEGVGTASANDRVSLDGLSTAEAKQNIVGWLEDTGYGRSAIIYRLRDWLFSRQRYWGEPFPIVYDETGLPIALPEDHLPVVLPDMADFSPRAHQDDDTAEPEPPLSRAKEWATVELDLGDGPKTYRRETNTMPQWAGSCWYELRYLDPGNDQALVDREIDRYWMGGDADDPAKSGGVDLYVGGVEQAVLHLLYARLWHKILYDLEHVSTPEPFHRLFNQGYILAAAYTDERGRYVPADEVEEEPDGTFTWGGKPVTRHYGKMGKSLKNGISPDEIYELYGADTLRLYEMAMGPLDTDRPWNTRDIVGVFRFLQRLWRNVVDEDTGQPTVADTPPGEETLRLLHRTITEVSSDFEQLRFNTAIARLTELNNHLTQAYEHRAGCPREVVEPLVLMVAPLAPHIAEELWSRLGHDRSLAYEPFPVANPQLVAGEEVDIPVQVQGRFRFEVRVPVDTDAETLTSAALGDDRLARYLKGHRVARVVAVPGRIVNIVTEPAQ